MGVAGFVGDLAAFFTSLPSLVGVKLMSLALLMGRAAPFARNVLLLVVIH
jgi:hypothetical protein